MAQPLGRKHLRETGDSMREMVTHTSLRGVAALLVVVFHYRTMFADEVGLDKFTSFFERSYVFVDMFFVLSGFVLSAVYVSKFEAGASRDRFVGFYGKRVARIYPLHIATMLVMIGLYLMKSRGDLWVLAGDVAENLAMVHAWGVSDRYVLNFPSWSISVEWAAYLVFPFLCMFMSRARMRVAMFLIVLGAYLYMAIAWGSLHHDERLGLVRGLPAFMLGVLVYRYRDSFQLRSGSVLSAIQFVAVLLVLVVMHFGLNDVLLIPLFASIIVTTWEDRGLLCRILSGSWFHALGIWSYSVYMLHIPVRSVGYHVYPRVDAYLPEGYERFTFALVLMAITISTSALAYRYFECPARDRTQAFLGRVTAKLLRKQA